MSKCKHSVNSFFYRRFCAQKIPNWYIFIYCVAYNLSHFFNRNKIHIKLPKYLNQLVHPSIVKHNGIYYMVATPYPYSDERYENPVLFQSVNLTTYIQVNKLPLALPRETNNRCHLSDPVIVSYDNQIHIFYREIEYDKDKTVTRLYSSSSSEISDLFDFKTVYLTHNCYLSPSIIYLNKEPFSYYVSREKGKYLLYRHSLINNVDFAELLNVDNMPEGMSLWHIEIRKYDNKFVGLFVLSCSSGNLSHRLFYALSDSLGKSWQILDEIKIVVNQEKYFRTIYKATFVELCNNHAKILISACTNSKSWHIYLLNIKL